MHALFTVVVAASIPVSYGAVTDHQDIPRYSDPYRSGQGECMHMCTEICDHYNTTKLMVQLTPQHFSGGKAEVSQRMSKYTLEITIIKLSPRLQANSQLCMCNHGPFQDISQQES